MNEENDKKLTKSLDSLSGQISKFNSLKMAFLRGIFFGVGSAIGASIIAAIVIAALNQVFKSIDEIPQLRTTKMIEVRE